MVADYLRGEIRKGKTVIHVTPPFQDLLWTFVANEGRSEEDGAKFKRFGVRPGNPDFLFWWGIEKSIWNWIVSFLHLPSWFFACHAAGIELKAGDNTQSPNQRDWESKMRTLGGQYAVCRSVAQVRDTLIGWGLKCHNTNCIEPAPTFEEKVDFMRGFYNPL